MPSHESYARACDPSIMGRYVAWGKTISPFLNQVADGHWEIRCLDWTANTYLAVAAFISADLLGIRNRESEIKKP